MVGNLIGSIIWGTLIAACVVGALWGVLRKLRVDVIQSPLSLIVLAVLFFLLGAQSTLLAGAFRLRGYTDEIASYVSSIVNTEESSLMDIEDIKSMRERLIDEYPVAKPFLESLDIQTAMDYVKNGRGLVSYVSDGINGMLSRYMLRRGLWMAGFVLLAMTIVLLTNRRRDYTYDFSDMDSIDII